MSTSYLRPFLKPVSKVICYQNNYFVRQHRWTYPNNLFLRKNRYRYEKWHYLSTLEFPQNEKKINSNDIKTDTANKSDGNPADSSEKFKITLKIDGKAVEVLTDPKDSLLQLMRENGMELAANCEGTMCCSVCMVTIPEEYQKFVPKIELNEKDTLDVYDANYPTVRLGCQIPVTKELDGAVFTLENKYVVPPKS